MSVICQKMNRRELLNYINEISFAVDDTKLFLDTHPWDQNALLFLMNAAESGMKHYGNMLLPMVRLRSILQLPVSLITGPGSMSHGHGRKEAAEYVEL